MPRQTTIKKSVSLKGVGIHTGKEVTLTFKPAEENFGYVFQRIDLFDKPLIEANINYVVNNEKEMKPVARVWSNQTGMGVQYSSDQPGLQFYTGGNMHLEYQGKNQRTYGKNYGLCMETQFFPDAINQDNFESPILKVGETYTSNTIIKLSNNYQ